MPQLSHQECVRLLATAAQEMRGAIASFADSATLAEIDRSIEQAKTASSGDLPNSELRVSANAATRLTGKAELCSQGLFLDESDRETALGQLSSDRLKSVRDVADVAARSLRAAIGNIDTANDECQEGITWAYALAERIGDDSLLARIEYIVDSAHSSGTHETGNNPMHSERRWWAFWEWLRRSPPPGDR
ncbi:hypothetical protein [Novipirellula caenicola]|uniref:DUF222 domain-containing protein n=1 Tax=Novipirellula caenicola TaxID=1536901 RepID=A0ABP9W3S4_9BACT